MKQVIRFSYCQSPPSYILSRTTGCGHCLLFYLLEMSVTTTMEPTTIDVSGLSKAREANWPAVLFFIHIHLLSLYGIWCLFYEAKLITILFLFVLTSFAMLGVTTGAHRLWAHNTYKATDELRVFLMLLHTLAGTGPIYDWVQNHRLHHAHYRTDYDPYDSRKGFFYPHIITRMRKLSPQQEALKNAIDMSDLENDSIVMFQKKYYWVLYAILFLLLPLNAPLEYFGDSVLSTVFVIGFLRYAIILHASWLLESGYCLWNLDEGEKYPPDTNLVFLINRTNWLAYHYIYPNDYKSGEYGTYGSGCSTAFIRIYAVLGLATDLNTLESKTLQKVLAEHIKTQRPLSECLKEGVKKQNLSSEHYLGN